MTSDPAYIAALEDFSRARRLAIIQDILARVTGHSQYLLSYEDVRKKLMAVEGSERTLKEIPLDAIIGSVGRYSDFTRSFLPRKSIDRERWARLKAAAYGTLGLPPVEVYQIGQVYFVQDGNHRVSIARQLGARTIQGYVREVRTPVPLSPTDRPDDLIIKAEYAEFLARTQINRLLPDAEIRVTTPGRFLTLLQQIDVMQFAREFETGEEVPYDEAVRLWYGTIYGPIVELIRAQRILAEFPGRTETDLFLWILKYRAELAKEVGWEVQTSAAAAELTRRKETGFFDPLKRAMDKLLPEAFKPVSPAGRWRERRQATREGRLFAEILVVIDGTNAGWQAFSQAAQIAWLEGARLRGLTITSPGQPYPEETRQALRSEFTRRCEAAQVAGELTFEAGARPTLIASRARLVDLVVIPAGILLSQKSAKALSLHCRVLLRRCPTPVLVTHEQGASFQRALLAYDGTPKSEQALFLASFMATFWELPLTMTSVLEGQRVTCHVLEQAMAYFERYGVCAEVVYGSGATVDSILTTAQDKQCDLLILGGYDRWNLKDLLAGDVLEKLLIRFNRTVLICN